jgi:hypothetical protein
MVRLEKITSFCFNAAVKCNVRRRVQISSYKISSQKLVRLICIVVGDICHKSVIACVSQYKVVQIWPGQTVTCLHTNRPGYIWTTLYSDKVGSDM